MKQKLTSSIICICSLLFLTLGHRTPAATVANCTEADLRAALAGGGTVTFACDGTITLSNTIVIAQNTTLDASGHQVTLSGQNAVRVLGVNTGVQFSMNNVTVANGRGTTEGGGLRNFGFAKLINCTFLANSTVGVGNLNFGGAILQGPGSGSLTVLGCSFLQNIATGSDNNPGYGGAISARYDPYSGSLSGLIFITNSTFFGNGASVGGAIFSSHSYPACTAPAPNPIVIVNCTFADNTNYAVASGCVTLKNSIVTSTVGPNFSGPIIDGGHNISSDASGGFTDPFSMQNTDPMLGPLADNGGRTLTLAPLPGSPAIDAGDNVACPSTDQRGVVRPYGPICDVGAVEATNASAGRSVLQFSASGFAISENGTNVTITVARTGGANGAVTVDFATADGSASAGSDYGATNGTLSFATGELMKTFKVRIIDNSIVQGNRTFNLALSQPTGGAILGLSNATVTIIDDDSVFSFSAASYSVSERSSAAVINVRRQGNVTGSSTVSFATTNGTALAGMDYIATNGMLFFSMNETNHIFTVPILSDSLDENDETVVLLLSNPTGGARLADPATATLTIVDHQTVTNCDEASLRAALAIGGPIRLACDGIIHLSSTVTIAQNTTLDASGHQVTLSGENAVQVLAVNQGVQFSMTNVTVANGRANEGGGLRNLGSTRLVNCTFLANSSVGSPNWGGAILQGDGSLTVLGCSFLQNIATGSNNNFGLGGAISARYDFSFGYAGPIFITNSTFFRNSASVGGAIYSSYTYPSCGGPAPIPIVIVNCTFADNTNNAVASGCVTLKNTIVTSAVGPNFSGPIIDGGHNISSDNSGNLTNAFSLNNTDPMLGPLTNNGGLTLTLAPLPGSPVIDGGDNAACPSTDQRGVVRPYGLYCDVGAVEATNASAGPSVLQLSAPGFAINENGTNVTITIVRAGGATDAVAVDFATADGSASAGSDYVATNGTLSFAIGERMKTFNVRVIDNSIVQGDRTFNLVLSQPTGGSILGLSNATVVIIEDDTAFSFSTASYTVSERSSAAIINVRRLGNVSGSSTVSFATTNGTALAGMDYVATSGMLQFFGNETNHTFTVPILSDSLDENDETVMLLLSNPTGGARLADPSTATLTIVDQSRIQTVTNCSEASLDAALAIGGPITLACDGIIPLSNALTVAQDTTLDASGHQVTLSGQNAVQVLAVNQGVQFTMINVTVANGRATEGGGLRNFGFTKLVNCTFLSNSTGPGGYGGAITHYNGSLTLLGCSFLNNISGFGGAITSRDYPALITNSTFFGNSASAGGAIYTSCIAAARNRIVIVNCTFADNTNNAVGGGGCGNNVILKNTIVRGAAGPNFSDPIIDGGHNISSDNSGNFTNAFSLNNTDPLLGPLADNGGPTLTLAILPGSPAIDAGDDHAAPETDQRGLDRLYGFASDIGAFEKNGPIYSIQGLIQGFTTPTNLMIAAGSFHTNTPNLNYVLRGLSNGTYTVTPAAPAFIFVPASRLVSLGPTNALHVDYIAYRSNALAIERITSGDFRCAYAGATGQTFVVQTSTNLKTWSAFSTNQIGTNGLFEWHDTNSPPRTIQGFRAVMP